MKHLEAPSQHPHPADVGDQRQRRLDERDRVERDRERAPEAVSFITGGQGVALENEAEKSVLE